MATRVIKRVYVHETDLWPGATDQDVISVVQALQGQGWPAKRASSPHMSNVTELLQFGDQYRHHVLATVKAAADQARQRGETQATRKLCRRRAELERAIEERDQAQAEVEAAAARLDRLQAAVDSFDDTVAEVNLPQSNGAVEERDVVTVR